MPRYLIPVIITVMLSCSATGKEFHLVLNGKSIHFEGSGWNEDNWGLGFEYNFDQRGRWIPLVSGSVFRDSNEDISKYLGGGIKARFPLGDIFHLDAGAFAFLMTRKDYNDNDPFIGALPFLSLGTQTIAINTTYVPAITPKSVDLVYFQATFKIWEG